MESQKIDWSLLYTTTTLGRVRGFTIELLFHLGDGPQRCCELAEKTEKKQNYVYSYLKNMRNYGLVEKEWAYWKLSRMGGEFLRYMNISYNNIYYYRKKEERRKKDIKSNRKLGLHLSTSKYIKQVNLDLFFADCTLDDAERVVVEVLVDHYNKTGSKFLYFKDSYEIAEKFNIHPDQVNRVLMNLKQDRIVYNFRDRRHNAWKIGLYKAFVELLTKT